MKKVTPNLKSIKTKQSESGIVDNGVTVSVRWLDVDESHESQRLDNFLITHLKSVPKSKVYQIIRKGEVRVNGGRKKPCYRLKVGDRLRIPPVRVSEKQPQNKIQAARFKDFRNWILFEDQKLLIVNKPTGLAVHGGSGLSFGLIELLRSNYPEHQYLELVHRLDRDTSGLILVAKKRSTLKRLHEQLRLRTFKKKYLAILRGHLPEQRMCVKNKLLKNVLSSGERLVKVDDRGKESITEFNRLKLLRNNTCLVEAMPVTGRTHQIRVHAQSLGCPILNDQKYGYTHEAVRDQPKQNGSLMLHASEVEFIHEEQSVRFEAPYPERFGV